MMIESSVTLHQVSTSFLLIHILLRIMTQRNSHMSSLSTFTGLIYSLLNTFFTLGALSYGQFVNQTANPCLVVEFYILSFNLF
jgi:hypothetical protein